MKKILLTVLGILVGVGVIGFALAVWLGYFPALSAKLGLGQPKNLQVTYTDDDYTSAKNKITAAVQGESVQQTFSDAELTALLNACTEAACIFDDAQVKTNADGSFEVSGVLDRERADTLLEASVAGSDGQAALSTALAYLPPRPAVYLKATVTGENDVITLQAESFTLGSFDFPAANMDQLSAGLSQAWSNYLAAVPGTQVTSLQVTSEGVAVDADLTAVNDQTSP